MRDKLRSPASLPGTNYQLMKRDKQLKLSKKGHNRQAYTFPLTLLNSEGARAEVAAVPQRKVYFITEKIKVKFN
jgi:hypothetical protein